MVGRLLLADTFDVVDGRTVLIVAYECTAHGDLDAAAAEEREAVKWIPLEQVDDIALPEIYRRAIGAAVESDLP